MDLFPFLRTLVERDGSDLFLSAGARPHARIHGVTAPIGEHVLSGGDVRTMAYTLMNERQMKQFETTLECNLGVAVGSIGRFRVNVYMQRGEPAAVLRYIRTEIPSFADLGLPREIEALAMQKHGLVIVAGPAGSGRSTTLAAMVDYRNTQDSGHILAIEDPIEYVHLHKKCIVDQREVGVDTMTLAEALRNALREEPDVVVLGEIADRETLRHAINYAENGRLCLAAMHANDSAQALERMLSFYPEAMHSQLLMELAINLRAVLCQHLKHGVDGKPQLVLEAAFRADEVAALLRKLKAPAEMVSA